MVEPTRRVIVVIRARDAEHDLRNALQAVSRQDIPTHVTVCTVVVDNESKDSTRDVAISHSAIVVPISAHDFTWGRALNRGIAAADADIVLLLSADATPVDESWLAAMIAPFADERVAAVYGRQEPRPDAPLDEAVRLRRSFDDKPRELTATSVETDRASRRWVCSNACAAVRVSVWEQIPFDEQVPASEEVPWIRAVLAAGWRAVYEPKARVYHSHRESVLRSAVRAWEFHKNAAFNGTAKPFGIPRLIASKIKGRLINCTRGGADRWTVARAILILPVECAAILAVAASSLRPQVYARVRSRAWRS
jgi:GT2 family glycosyltransferase